MLISKEEIHKLVEPFYQPKFLTFFVNSLDGKTFSNPVGVFVSLGITTPLQKMKSIEKVINETSDYNANIAEIKTSKVAGQYMNSITNNEVIEQYTVDEFPEKVFNKTESSKRLKELKKLVSKDSSIEIIKNVMPKISQLENIIKKLDSSGWEGHYIQEFESEFRLFHSRVNYKKNEDNNDEYRIGIFVSNK